MTKNNEVLINQVFGRWMVVSRGTDYITPKGFKMPRWVVQCSCEQHTIKEVREDHLLDGTSTSCGCLQKENMSKAKKKYNTYDLSGEYGIGWTTNTNQEFYFDINRYDDIKNICWYQESAGYVVGRDTKSNRIVKMHVYLGYKYHDHINRNKLDNRSDNLRPCEQQENCRNGSLRKTNTSGVTGVNWSKSHNAWIARVYINYKEICLGYFDNKEDAIKARLQAEANYYGEFAPQQHLFAEYGIK